MASKFYESQRGTLQYDKRGMGDPVLLVHGWYIGASHAEFARNVGELQRHFTVYAIDLLGFGQSAAPRITHTAELHAHLLRDFISDVIERPTRVVASGVSCGFVTRLSVFDSQLVDRLTLICPREKFTPDHVPFTARASQFLMGTLACASGLYETASSRPSLAMFLHERYHDRKNITPHKLDDLEAGAAVANAMMTYTSLLNGYVDAEVYRPLRHARATTQIIWGTDLGEPPVDQIFVPAAWSKGKRLDRVEGAAHWPHDERSSLVNRLMIDFLTPEHAPVQDAPPPVPQRSNAPQSNFPVIGPLQSTPPETKPLPN